MRGKEISVLEQAAAWAARLQSGTADEGTRAQFRAWLDGAAEHRRAYESIERAWALTGALPEEACRELCAEAYALKAGGSQKRRRGAFVAAAIAAAVILMAGGASLFWPFLSGGGKAPGPQIFVTAIGERSTVTLADGSLATLNTDSRLEVDFSPSSRNVRLVSGQAHFKVEKDKHRPFVVSAGERTITALGTEFDVRLDHDQVEVTLIEGRVRVHLSETARGNGDRIQSAELTPGQQLVATGTRRVSVRRARLEQVSGWRDGRLIFENEPLANAVAEVNRYSTTRLVLKDPGLNDLRISGVFRTGQPQNFVQALTVYFPIHAMPSPSRDAIILTNHE